MKAMKDDQTDICICGAGPVGLLLGNLLGQAGLRVTLLERHLHAPSASMAIGITPPSLKILEQLDLADAFLDQGQTVQEAIVFEKGRRVGDLSFACLYGDYRFILSLPQCETVRILETHVRRYPNVRVLRGQRLERIRQYDDHVECTVWNTATASYDVLRATYLVGCDGVQSRVRREAGIPIRKRPYPQRFVMADFDDRSGLDSRACLFFTPEGSVESFPLPGLRRRWIVQLDGIDEQTQSRSDLVERLVRERSGLTLSGSKKRFQSHFSVQRMLAQRYFDNRIVLCGDAAHAMSPVGGQGMNTGFADAALLAETLVPLTENGGAGNRGLRQYERQRKRAYRVAAFRAARNMWIGTRRGPIWSKLRYCLLHSLLERSEALHLAEHFAMLTIPQPKLGSLAV